MCVRLINVFFYPPVFVARARVCVCVRADCVCVCVCADCVYQCACARARVCVCRQCVCVRVCVCDHSARMRVCVGEIALNRSTPTWLYRFQKETQPHTNRGHNKRTHVRSKYMYKVTFYV
jgi:hypothetical protein